MKKLVTALIIILPLVLLVALFAVTGIARISADIPANGLVINNKGKDGVMFFDIADYRHPLYESDLGIEVLPRVARNKGYDLKITDIAGRPTDIVTREKDGSFAFHGTGLTKLTYTSRDGGYSDSILFNVSASAPIAFVPRLTDLKGNEYAFEEGTDTDYKITINSGKYAMSAIYSPSSVIYTCAEYKSSNDKILHFTDKNGRFNATFCGETVITVAADGANGRLIKTVAVSVKASADTTLNGMDISDNARVNTPIGAKSITLGVQSTLNVTAEDIAVQGENIGEYTAAAVDGVDGAFQVNVKLNSQVNDVKSELCRLSIGETGYDFYIDYANRDFSVYAPANAGGSGDITMLVGVDTKLIISSNPHSQNISYEWFIGEQEAISIVSSSGNECVLSANAAFGATLTVKWTEYGDDGEIIASGITERTVNAIHGYSAIIFAENAITYGLGGLAIATDKYGKDGKLIPYTHESRFRAFDKNANPADIFDMEFTVSDPSLASVRYDGANLFINALGDGEVTITAKWKYGALFGIEPATLTVKTVKGVAADSDESLRRAFSQSLAVVLTDDIYLGENLFETTSSGGRKPKYAPEVMREKLLSYTSEMPTTGDWKYYENMGLPHPSIRYCLDITSDLHGNGRFISAQYITDMLDGTDTLYDFAVFKGPLDFVATNVTGLKLASVKGQDNIVFLVRKDGVCIDNAVLKGCDDQTLYDNGAINLSLLNNVGTTLEIMCDATITRSRIMNGRTVARVFGRDGIDDATSVNAAAEKINAVFDGCVLQNAREFILKIGTNRVVRGTIQEPSPFLYGADGEEYGYFNSPDCDGYIGDDYFTSNYVLTDVTLKDTTLRTSGLLSIGMESHFSGPMLAGDPKVIFVIEGWRDIAGTSYPAMLHLVGNVEIADWKDVQSVDSSSLVEADTTQDALAFLALNIGEMLKTVQQYGGDKYSDIITDRKGKKLVHGGIAFYGGGKNYSILDMSQYTGKAMKNYNVNLKILQNSKDKIIANQGYFLPLAAGYNDFRFILQTEYDG